MKHYKNTWESINTHEIPEWYHNAKFGIFVHWGIYSVPAYAPLTGELGKIEDAEYWYTHNPYAEWYYNSINLKKGPTYEHHLSTYGKDFTYDDFIPMWKAEKFDPVHWAEVFKKAGAQYVVLTTKHHDGFCLFDSSYTDYCSTKMGPHKDLTGMLTEAVTNAGMKMGLYYSGLIDWQFYNEPITTSGECSLNYPPTFEYADYSYKQMTELVDRYHPSIIWNDIGWPAQSQHMLPYFLAHYFNTVEDAVVNDRFSDYYHGFLTKEYEFGTTDRSQKWEQTRGLGYSFGYNANETEETLISEHALISLLVSTVANNGNLLLNIGPRADGILPELYVKRLEELGLWLNTYGEGIYGTTIDHRVSQKLENGIELHYTRKGSTLYCFIDHVSVGDTFCIPDTSAIFKPMDNFVTFTQKAADNGRQITITALPANCTVIGIYGETD